jgi:hypothetical protein
MVQPTKILNFTLDLMKISDNNKESIFTLGDILFSTQLPQSGIVRCTITPSLSLRKRLKDKGSNS